MKANGTGRDKGITIQEVAKRTGMTEHNLRYYERVGMLEPVYRDESSRHRRYFAADITKIETLSCLRALGMPLEQMRRYFELIPQGKAAAPQLQALLEAQQRVLEQRLQQMQQHMDYIKHKIAYWRAIESQDDQAVAEIVKKLAHQIRAYTRCSSPNTDFSDTEPD